MKRLALFLFSLLVCGFAQAQDPADYVHLFADNVRVRSAPNTSGEVVATLSIGYPIVVDDPTWTSPQKVIGPLPHPWARVRFVDPEKGEWTTGFIWGGLLPELEMELDEGKWLILGYDLRSDEAAGLAKIVDKRTLLDTATFYIPNAMDGYYSAGQELRVIDESNNFDGSPKIISLFTPNPGECGLWEGDVIFTWINETLDQPFQAGWVSDGFSSTDEIIWPSHEDGKPGYVTIIHVEEDGDYYGETQSKYHWTGERFAAQYVRKSVD